MISCYLDPIYLSFKIDETTQMPTIPCKIYWEKVFLTFNDFIKKLKQSRSELGDIHFQINIPGEIIQECLILNPLDQSRKRMFKNVIEEFFRIYRNKRCKLSYIQETPKNFIYMNNKVPNRIIKLWNLFLNQCFDHLHKLHSDLDAFLKFDLINCMGIGVRDFLTNEEYGSKCKEGFPNFFTGKEIIEIIEWFELKMELIKSNVKTPEGIGCWDHHTSNKINKILNILTKREDIINIKRIGMSYKVNRTIITSISNNLIKLHIKTGEGSIKFLLTSNAINENHNKAIIEDIKNKNPEFL